MIPLFDANLRRKGALPTYLLEDVVDHAVDHQGVLIVRAATVMRLMGLSPSHVTVWSRSIGTTYRFEAPRSQKAPTGVIVAWPLAETLNKIRNYLPQTLRRWSEDEIDQVVERLGPMTTTEMGSRGGRSAHAIRSKLRGYGINYRTAQGWLTTNQVGVLLRRAPQQVKRWCITKAKPGDRRRRTPCPHTWTGGDRPVRQFDMVKVLAWLKSRPQIWEGLDRDVKKDLERFYGNEGNKARREIARTL